MIHRDFQRWVRFTPWVVVALAFATTAVAAEELREGDGKRWYKGNTHAHTLWSDGDGAPEVVVDWYRSHGYDFLALSDHNVFADREVWFPVRENSRLTPERVAEIQAQFGEGWVELRENGTRLRMRLKTLPELKDRFEEPERFLLIPAEEVTAPMAHINAVNTRGVIKAIPAEGVRDTLQKNLQAIEAHGREMGVPVLAHINHPNWGDGISAEDIIAVGGERFFEVYNGHSGVKNWGDPKLHRVSTDRMWDIILAMRMKDGATHPIFGMGTDDSHEYYEFGLGHVNSGRGWVHVLADSLTPEALITAMKRGEFYASTGVTLESVAWDDHGLRVRIDAEPGITYATQFIGTPKNFDHTSKPVLDAAGDPIPWATRIYSDDVGTVFAESTENPAVYAFTGDELYVRAKIISSKKQDNPFAAGDLETAWTQPVPVK